MLTGTRVHLIGGNNWMLYFAGMMTGQENPVFWKQKYDIASSNTKPKDYEGQVGRKAVLTSQVMNIVLNGV